MRRPKGEKLFQVINIFLLIILCIIMLYPYLNQVAMSFNEGVDSMKGGITLFPRKFTLQNYISAFKNQKFISATLISVSRVIVTTILSIIVSFSAAYE